MLVSLVGVLPLWVLPAIAAFRGELLLLSYIIYAGTSVRWSRGRHNLARQEILMKVLPLAFSIVAVSAASAFAADLPAKVYTKAPAVAPGFSWTGFYVGGGGGQGFLTSEARPIDSATGLPLNSGITNGGRGIFGTVSAGYDYQFSDRIVGGVLANYDFSNIRGFFSSGSAIDFFETLGARAQLDSSWAVGGRVGWLLDPKTLTYFNGGYTEARFTGQRLEGLNNNFPTNGMFLNGHTYSGWFLGSGVETKLLPARQWLVRAHRVPLRGLRIGNPAHADRRRTDFAGRRFPVGAYEPGGANRPHRIKLQVQYGRRSGNQLCRGPDRAGQLDRLPHRRRRGGTACPILTSRHSIP
jgi:outer membrane immunogenic protein